MIGDTAYKFITGDDGEITLLKTIHVSLNEVELSQDDDGNISVLAAKPTRPPKASNAKYRLDAAQDGLFRPVLLRSITGFPQGTVGGLVSGQRNLSQSGQCWIDYDSKVIGEAIVDGHARIIGSDITGEGTIYGEARLTRCTVESSAKVTISGSANLTDVRFTGDGQVEIRGLCDISASTLRADDYLCVSGCNVSGADIRSEYELLSVWTRWGWLSAFRDRLGQLQLTVGCQHAQDFDSIRAIAAANDVAAVERQMLEGFLQMVAVAQQQWKPVQPQEPVEAESLISRLLRPTLD